MAGKKTGSCVLYPVEGESAIIFPEDYSILEKKLIFNYPPQILEKKPILEKKLICSIREGNFNKVSSLVELGANINKKDIDGWSPLTCAVFWGYEKIVKLLVDKGADVNNIDNHGCSVLDKSFPGKSNFVADEKYMLIGTFLASKGAKYIKNGIEYPQITSKFLYNDW
jgi:hypothetical protein